MRVHLTLVTFALCAILASASTPIIQQVAQLASEYQHNLAGKVEDQTCGRGGECYDMRLQNVKGCTDGWALHGLWPQWSESCSREKFDYNEISDLADELKKYGKDHKLVILENADHFSNTLNCINTEKS